MLIVVIFCATAVLPMDQDVSMSLDERSQNEFGSSLETDVGRRKRATDCWSNSFSCTDNGCSKDSGGTKGCQSFWTGSGRRRRLTCRCSSAGFG